MIIICSNCLSNNVDLDEKIELHKTISTQILSEYGKPPNTKYLLKIIKFTHCISCDHKVNFKVTFEETNNP